MRWRETLTTVLVNRLRIVDYLKRNPELLQRPVEKPMFVFGLPRTGTTLTINLLGADPMRRCLLRWEALQPVPPAKKGKLHTDLRCGAQRQTLDAMLKIAPQIAAAHFEEADSPTECQYAMQLSFCAEIFDSILQIPGYRRWFLHETGYRDLKPLSPYNLDYHMLATMKEEYILRPIRNHLVGAGVPVENTKGEAEAGQEELNIRYADAMNCADHHVIAKQAVKEIAFQHGRSATFLPKWHPEKVGSAAHVHLSLWQDGTPAFYDGGAPHGMSDLMKCFVAGLLKYAPDVTYFLAPYVNSYKRFMKGTFAPTKIAWSVDNRTSAFRLCGEGTKAVRIECRVPGSDMNPFLAEAALLAAGLKGIEEGLELDGPATGDIYDKTDMAEVPRNLVAATATLRNSAMLREMFGDWTVDHYTRAAEVEQEMFDAAVTDWEIARGFEKA